MSVDEQRAFWTEMRRGLLTMKNAIESCGASRENVWRVGHQVLVVVILAIEQHWRIAPRMPR